jgi:hypothetical protein
MVKEMFGKFMNSSLPQKAKWAAITNVIEPAIIYPLVNIFFSENDPLDSLTSRMKCVALGLNQNFPRTILHGSPYLGGIGIPSTSQKNTRERLNYFFYTTSAMNL